MKGSSGKQNAFFGCKHSHATKIKMRLAKIGKTGENSNNWRGGVSKGHRTLSTPGVREWREHVFRRDDYTCQSCGLRGVELHADHELPWSKFPELRFEILNGRALCVRCHQKTPTYKGRAGRVDSDLEVIEKAYAI